MSLKSPPTRQRADAMAPESRAIDLAFYGAAALIIAGIVHIGSILVLPRNSEADAYARVRSLTHDALLQTVVGPPLAAGLFPYRDPAVATAFCMYDLAAAPMRVSINVTASDFLSVSAHGRHGSVFYALTNRSASHGVLALHLMTAAQMAAADAADTEGDALQDLRVLAPEPKGFIAVQALSATPSEASAAEAETRKLLCRSDATP